MDYQRIIREGEILASEYAYGNRPVTDKDIAWGLFCNALKVAQTWPSPPRTTYPAKSAMPEAPDDITYFQKLSLALQTGEPINDVAGETRVRFTPSAADQTRAEIVLDAFHKGCLQVGDRKRLRGAMVALGLGVKPIRVRKITGLDRGRLQRAKRKMCDEMLDVLKRVV